jgi:hypothetical protein
MTAPYVSVYWTVARTEGGAILPIVWLLKSTVHSRFFELC